MKLTNKLNLPKAFMEYATNDNHPNIANRYSVTQLLQPNREIMLYKLYENDIEEDVSEIIPALFGSAVHSILEINTPKEDGVLTEESVSYDFNGTTVSGRIDLLNLNTMTIEDYKTCSVSKIMKADFDDWKMQGLLYAYLLFKERDIIIRHLRFYALMKDWSKIKSQSSANYPSNPVYVFEYDIQDSDYDYADIWLRNKIKELLSGELFECTDEERWYTGTKYAVYKEGAKKATAVCNSLEEAEQYLAEGGKIEVRKGEDLKCKYYCSVRKFCKCGKGE